MGDEMGRGCGYIAWHGRGEDKRDPEREGKSQNEARHHETR